MDAPEKLPLRELAEWLKYYRQLGFTHLYRRENITALSSSQNAAGSGPPPPVERVAAAPPRLAETSYPILQPSHQQEDLFVPVAARETLPQIRKDLGDCRRCKLWEGRKTIVFGDGNPNAELVFVGEGPGADEDEQGLPFVGRAGQLLTDMIEKGMKLARRDVYICNIIKCRPPANRKPEKDEVAACRQFVERQVDSIRPRVVCALGATAAETLLDVREPMHKLRGQWFAFHGIPLLVTYHPAFLLRDPSKKGEAWADLKKILEFLKSDSRT
ncbi:MAG: hypothetical protein A3H27_12110 [Acidobacteria bacterium RIFCSPLOWO2_02_FULL_59_13]|nr:MAG: hypothetical protein A3H27_12110 [Acidobacteria bacterium RIFCSPLOWO2_02_FULL_59_13]